MNKGIQLSSGKLIGIINADDWYEPDAIGTVVAEFDHQEDTLFHGDLRVYQGDKEAFIRSPRGSLKGLHKGMILNHPATFIPLSFYKKWGLFDERYRIAADWDLILRFWRNGLRFKYINQIMANYRLGGTSDVLSKAYIAEKHTIRKKNAAYAWVDVHFLVDLIKLVLPLKLALNIIIMRQRLNGSLRVSKGK